MRVSGLCGLILLVAAPAAAGERSANPAPRGGVDFAATTAKIVKVYEVFGRVDDEMRWAPGLCRMPRAPQARLSTTEKDEPHGEKLYAIYAKDPAPWGYPKGMQMFSMALEPTEVRDLMKALEPVEQIIIKESWTPKKLSKEEAGGGRLGGAQGLVPAERDGVSYGAGEKSALYIMFRMGEKTPNTDEGWVYATADAKGKVTEVGAIESCVKCHRAVESRIFGFPDAKK